MGHANNGTAGRSHNGRRLDSNPENRSNSLKSESLTAFTLAAGAIGLGISMMESEKAAAAEKAEASENDVSSAVSHAVADGSHQVAVGGVDLAYGDHGAVRLATAETASAHETAAMQEIGHESGVVAETTQTQVGAESDAQVDAAHIASDSAETSPDAVQQIADASNSSSPTTGSQFADAGHTIGTGGHLVEVSTDSPVHQVGGVHIPLPENTAETPDHVLGGVTDALGDVVSGVTDGLGDTLGGVTDALGDVVSGVTDGLGDTLGGVTDALGDVVSGVTDGLGDALGGVTDALGDVVSGVTDGLGDTLGGVTDALGDVVSGVTDGLGDTLGGVTDALGDVVSGVTDGLGDALGGVTDALGDVVSGVTDGLGDTLGGVTDALGDVASSVVGEVDNTLTGVTALLGPILGGSDGSSNDPSIDAANIVLTSSIQDSGTSASSTEQAQTDMFDAAHDALGNIEGILSSLVPDLTFIGQSLVNMGEHHDLSNSHGSLLNGFL